MTEPPNGDRPNTHPPSAAAAQPPLTRAKLRQVRGHPHANLLGRPEAETVMFAQPLGSL